MAALLSPADFRTRSVMPTEDVDALEAQYPGLVAKLIGGREAWMHARLAKRYAVPFDAASPPEVALEWVTALVTIALYMRRGFNPSSEQDNLIVSEANRAQTEILEAANSETGLFELPLRQDAPSVGGAIGAEPFGYSEATPYDWLDVQRGCS